MGGCGDGVIEEEHSPRLRRRLDVSIKELIRTKDQILESLFA